MRELELLAPATNKEIAMRAILHGADAVYIGASSHGARKKASNSVADIAELATFAHKYRARVYVTVNTLVYEKELAEVERLVWDLYRAGVDALIVQDMSLLRMHLPPIALHASTQCDTRTPEKAKFLEDVGFSQIVLARELTIDEIRNITASVSVHVECFVHGALCVSYSGKCGASCVSLGRSANRGECAQMCRMPYSLINGNGETVLKDKYLLSLRDFNASANLQEMVEAGVSSFKIEGRLKDADYVKNVTAFYRGLLDRIIAANPDKYCRSSYGKSELKFTPQLDKSFNRGFTDYFLSSRHPGTMASTLTPKSMGEEISDIRMLHNGDGVSFFSESGEYTGLRVNRVDNDRIQFSRPFRLPKGTTLHRTFDAEWQKLMQSDTAKRFIWVDITVDNTGVSATDERGVKVRVALDVTRSKAEKRMEIRHIFAKLGNTHYRLRNFENRMDDDVFIPASQLTAVRRTLVGALDMGNLDTYQFDKRRVEKKDAIYPSISLDERDNVVNSLAERFYHEHGVKNIKHGYEVEKPGKQATMMTTRYCLRRELGCCLRDKKVDERTRKRYAAPLKLTTGPHTFELHFDCSRCEMNLKLPE